MVSFLMAVEGLHILESLLDKEGLLDLEGILDHLNLEGLST